MGFLKAPLLPLVSFLNDHKTDHIQHSEGTEKQINLKRML
jgi:hypothetical protein